MTKLNSLVSPQLLKKTNYRSKIESAFNNINALKILRSIGSIMIRKVKLMYKKVMQLSVVNSKICELKFNTCNFVLPKTTDLMKK